MATLKSESSGISIEINLRNITYFDDAKSKLLRVYYHVSVLYDGDTILNQKLSDNEFLGWCEGGFCLPNEFRYATTQDKISVITTTDDNFEKFIIFPSTLIPFYDGWSESELFTFGFWITERSFRFESRVDEDFMDGKVMFLLEVEKVSLVAFADELEGEFLEMGG